MIEVKWEEIDENKREMGGKGGKWKRDGMKGRKMNEK